MNHASYLELPINHPHVLVDFVKQQVDFLGGVDALVGCGLSGAMAVPLVTKELDLRMCIVRKDDDRGTHSAFRYEGNMRHNDRWVFLDDLISSGNTVRYVCEMMDNYPMGKGERFHFAGAVLYVCQIAYTAETVREMYRTV